MGDADDSYDFQSLALFLERAARRAHDLVMGNRFQGGIEPGRDAAVNRYPRQSHPRTGIGRHGCFAARSETFTCGLRGFSKRAIETRAADHGHGIRDRDGREVDAARAADY